MPSANDHLASAAVLSGASGSTSLDFTGAGYLETGSINWYGAGTGEVNWWGGPHKSLWFRWTAPADMEVLFRLSSGAPAEWDIAAGPDAADFDEWATNDDDGLTTWSWQGDPFDCHFDAVEGETYLLFVDDYSYEQGASPSTSVVLAWQVYTPPPPSPTAGSWSSDAGFPDDHVIIDGCDVDLAGTHLDVLDSVTVGGVSQSYTVNSPTSITIHISGTALSGNIVVSNVSGSDPAAGAAEMWYPGPWITDSTVYEQAMGPGAWPGNENLTHSKAWNVVRAGSSPDLFFGGHTAASLQGPYAYFGMTVPEYDMAVDARWTNGNDSAQTWRCDYAVVNESDVAKTSDPWRAQPPGYSSSGTRLDIDKPALPPDAVGGEYTAPEITSWGFTINVVVESLGYSEEYLQVDADPDTAVELGDPPTVTVELIENLVDTSAFGGTFTPSPGVLALLNPFLSYDGYTSSFDYTADTVDVLDSALPIAPTSFDVETLPTADIGVQVKHSSTVDDGTSDANFVPFPDFATVRAASPNAGDPNEPTRAEQGFSSYARADIDDRLVKYTLGAYRLWYLTPQTTPALRQRQRGDGLAGGGPRQIRVPTLGVRQGPQAIR